jgi:ParB family chromosome partitioning protein
MHIPVGEISPNPRQPRSHFDPQEMADLEASIRAHGVLQPLIVTRGAMPDQYVLVAGERRWLAAQRAELGTVPAILREASDQQLVELALVENVQRADLQPLEAAEAYRQLSEEFHLSHDEVAARVGKSRVAITNTLRLLKLPAEVQQALVDGKISEGHARALLALPGPDAQCAALKTILEHGLNVRQAEELVRKLSGERPKPKLRPAPLPEIAELEERLRKRLGTRVRLSRRGRGGTVTISFFSDEELEALIQAILGDEA